MNSETRNGYEKELPLEEQQKKISEIRKLLGPVSDKLSMYCTDASIARYLRARNWNVKKALKMLKETLKWRSSYKPEEIIWNTNSTKGQIKYLVYCMENAIINLPAEHEQMVWLIDFDGFNLSHVSVKATRETARVLQEHYPERLGLAILYNPPKIFESFWTVVKPFLEPKTYCKVKFVYSGDPISKKIMEHHFDISTLETAFGGRSELGFDINEYAERMKQDDQKRLVFWNRENNHLPVSPSNGAVTSSTTEKPESDSDESVEISDQNPLDGTAPRNQSETNRFGSIVRNDSCNGTEKQPSSSNGDAAGVSSTTGESSWESEYTRYVINSNN